MRTGGYRIPSKILSLAPERVFFTADLHFGHRRMLDFRPFPTVEAMNAALIEGWNRVVSLRDTVVVCGDFSLLDRKRVKPIREQLNGRIVLVRGNHDNHKALVWFDQVEDLLRVKVGDQLIVCCHYPLAVWEAAQYGSWHLHGHSHGSHASDGKKLDVGVDAHRTWQPISYREVAAFMAGRSYAALDYHTDRT